MQLSRMSKSRKLGQRCALVIAQAHQDDHETNQEPTVLSIPRSQLQMALIMFPISTSELVPRIKSIAILAVLRVWDHNWYWARLSWETTRSTSHHRSNLRSQHHDAKQMHARVNGSHRRHLRNRYDMSIKSRSRTGFNYFKNKKPRPGASLNQDQKHQIAVSRWTQFEDTEKE